MGVESNHEILIDLEFSPKRHWTGKKFSTPIQFNIYDISLVVKNKNNKSNFPGCKLTKLKICMADGFCYIFDDKEVPEIKSNSYEILKLGKFKTLFEGPTNISCNIETKNKSNVQAYQINEQSQREEKVPEINAWIKNIYFARHYEMQIYWLTLLVIIIGIATFIHSIISNQQVKDFYIGLFKIICKFLGCCDAG